MRHLTYLGVLLGCGIAVVWLVPVLGVDVHRQWRRLLATVVPVATVITCLDVAAIRAGYWWFDRGQTLGVFLPGGVPIEELLFFVVVPVCAIFGFEAVRTVLSRSHPYRQRR